MTKTKRQLRAEAVERLMEINAATGMRHIDVVEALVPDAPRTSQDIRAALIDLLTDDERVMTNLEWLYRENKTFHVVCMAFAEGYIDMMTPREEWLLSPHSKSHSHSEPLSDSERGQRERESAMDENGTGNGTCPDAIGQSSNHSKAQSKDAPTLSGLYGVLSDDCGQNADMSQKDGDCVREGWETSNSGTAEAETSQLPESDTREKLEADVRDYWYHTRGGWETAKVYEWLDRQAAITQAEFAGEIEIWKSGFRDISKKLEASTQACDDYRSEWHRVCADRADLQRELTTEKNKGIELAEQLGKAMAERDEYRAKVGAMLDAAQEIRRLGDIE